MPKNSGTNALDQLKGFLNQLFQFDTQDLDFGVYKILHYKKKEIANFIEHLLVDKVREQLLTLSADKTKQVKEQITELEKDDIIKGWLEAEAEEKQTLEKFGKDKINQYKELKAKAKEATVSVETENQIYTSLCSSHAIMTKATSLANAGSGRMKNMWCPTTERKHIFIGQTTISITSNHPRRFSSMPLRYKRSPETWW